jgi:transcriptional regulator with XRE-family HTH domain
MEIGARIRKLRLDRKLGQAQLAALLGIVQSTLSKVERGVLRPTVDMLMRLAQLFGMPPGDWFTPLPPVAA